MAADDALLVHREPPLAWVVVNRPQARNALSVAVWEGLADAITALGADRDVRVVIVRGAGEQAFISGADISEFRAVRADAAATAAYDQVSGRAWAALMHAPQPVMAMIHGFCFGGGVAVALACDLRFASAEARFAVPATRLGLSYPFESIVRLVQVVGPTHAADILLSARTLNAGDAMHIGLVNRVLPAAELEAATREYALAMAHGAPLTVAAHKRAIREALRAPADRDMAGLREAMRRCFDSADYQEGIAAFLEKRPPRFQGR
ncbi:enoyl-CoA hydratase/isomerase family protein [bacterium]|nr:enoyl-CoA hydratase/isomerase family protein [bacterium]